MYGIRELTAIDLAVARFQVEIHPYKMLPNQEMVYVAQKLNERTGILSDQHPSLYY